MPDGCELGLGLQSERHFRTEIQSEMSELRRELLQQRKAGRVLQALAVKSCDEGYAY